MSDPQTTVRQNVAPETSPRALKPVVSTTKSPHFKPPRAAPAKKLLSLQSLDTVEYEEFRWLWYPYIPAGKLTLLEGDPGQGKSFISCAIAADLSTGRLMPFQKKPNTPGRVVMLSAEDGLGDTVLPRVQAMGGDLSKISASEDFFILDKQGLAEFENEIRTAKATIVFIDPIVAYMGSKVDMHRANEVREIMAQLKEIAHSTGTAIVAVRHLRKAQGGKAIYSGIGSIDFTASARSVLQVHETKGGTKYLYHVKHNNSPKGESIAYTIDNGVFKWQGALKDIDDEDEKKVSKKPKAVVDAENFLLDLLKDGPVPALTVHEGAAKRGLSMSAVQRAKKGIAVSQKTPAGEWYWYLLGGEGTPPGPNADIDELLAYAKTRLPNL